MTTIEVFRHQLERLQMVCDDPLFDDDAGAEYIDVSKRTFQRMRHEGLIEYIRIGKRCVRVRKKVLDDLKAARSHSSRAAELAAA